MGYRGEALRYRGVWTLAILVVAGMLTIPVAATRAMPPPVPASAPHEVKPEPVLLEARGPETLLVRVISGYCSGDPYRPVIARVGVRWQRLGPFHFRAVLTAFVRDPVYPPPPPSPPPSPTAEGPTNVTICAGLGYELRAKVELPQPIARTELLDGSYSPPRPARRNRF